MISPSRWDVMRSMAPIMCTEHLVAEPEHHEAMSEYYVARLEGV